VEQGEGGFRGFFCASFAARCGVMLARAKGSVDGAENARWGEF